MPADAASTPAKGDKLTADKSTRASLRTEVGESSARANESRALEVTLEHGRSRHIGWAAFGLVAGAALLLKLGTIGQFLGAVLIASALFQLYKATMTFVHPPGTFKVGPEHIVIPTGLCRGRDLVLQPSDLQHAYLLRRAVPWTIAGPLLVIESGGKSFGFPRDWFASDSDQRRVERALNRGQTTSESAA